MSIHNRSRESGQAGIDPHLRIVRAGDLECLIHRWQPAHTLVLFDYSGISDPYAGADRFNVTLRAGDEIQLRDARYVIDERPITVFWPQAPTSFYTGSPTFDMPVMIQAGDIPDPSTSLWMNSVIARGGTVTSDRQRIVDLLVKGLKADGLWPLRDGLLLPASADQVSALTDLVSLRVAVNVNNCAFNADRGFYAYYSNSYIDTKFNPTVAGSKFTRNNGHFALMTDIGGGVPANAFIFGTLNPGTTGATYRNYIDLADGGYSYFAINDASGASMLNWFSDPQGLGFYAVNRSATNQSQVYRNGHQRIPMTTPSVAPSTATFTFCGAFGYYSSMRVNVVCYGASLTAAQHLALWTRISNYLNAVGVSFSP